MMRGSEIGSSTCVSTGGESESLILKGGNVRGPENEGKDRQSQHPPRQQSAGTDEHRYITS